MGHDTNRYSFADCQLDAGRREIRRDRAIISLRPKVFDMLTLLIEQHDRVVSKDELLDQVWPGRYISETTLSACLKELRKAIGDDGKEQNIIKTVRGQGFRFIAALNNPASDQPTTPVQDHQHNPPDAASSVSPSIPSDDLARTDQTPSSERKNVSALQCGLIDAAELAERLGPEAMHYFLQDFFALAQDIVARFDGQVTQWLSAGFVALFGAAVAHEDHARRALLAAFELLERSQDQRQQPQAKISFGLTSGAVIVSRSPGNSQQHYTTFNTVIGLAETLQTLAGASELLISAASYRLLRADVRVRTVTGHPDVFSVEKMIPPRAGVPRRFRRPLAPLIGRHQELSLLHERLNQADEGQGQVVAIAGNPGIGKSRLLTEFRQSLDQQNSRCLQANCFPHFNSTPYYPLADYLRQHCGIHDADPANLVQDKLSSRLKAAELTQPEALPLLLKLLELPHDDGALLAQQLSAQAQRDKTCFYLQQLLLNSAQTTVLVLEDLHWLDASSQAWLDALIQQLGNRPVLLMTTYRPGINPTWLQFPWASQLALGGLSQDHCLRLLCSLPRASALQDRLLALATRSGGNPFFLEELALNSVNSDQPIPDTVQGVLAARIDQLASSDKKLLQVAAIIGQRGIIKVLATVSELDADALASALLRLQSAELLFNDFAKGEQLFVFKHALVQEVAYVNLLSNQRQALHARVVEVLHADFNELCARRPELLAYHHGNAGHYEDAVRYWQRAGRMAYERSAYVETIDYVKQGLALVERFDDPTARAVAELNLHRTLGPTLMSTLGYGATEVEHTWMRAKQLCEALEDPASLFRVLLGLSNYYWVSGDFNKALDCNRQLLRLARRANNNRLLLRANAAMGELMLHNGRMPSAKRYLDRCLALAATEDQPILAIQSSAVAATCYSAWVSWYQGQEDMALNFAEQALQRARALKQPFTLAIALCLTAELHRFRNDPDQAMTLAEEGVALSSEQGFPFWHGSTLVTLGWAEACIDNAHQGVDTIRRGITIFRSTGAKVQLTSWLGALADAYRMNGQTAKALATIEEAISWAQQTGDCYYLPQLFNLQKHLLGLGDQQANVQNVQDAVNNIAGGKSLSPLKRDTCRS